MQSLDFLIDKGLIDQDQRPIRQIGPIKIVRHGVIMQQLCRNGLRYDIAVSWLQKAIRRGLVHDALYCAYQIADLCTTDDTHKLIEGGMFVSHLLNRLMTIMSEDIGPAEPAITQLCVPIYLKIHRNYDDMELVHREIINLI